MGKYLEKTSQGSFGASYYDKCKALIEDDATMLKNDPDKWSPNMICVVDNGTFAAAAYAHDEKEFNRFKDSFEKYGDKRKHAWFIYDKVEELI